MAADEFQAGKLIGTEVSGLKIFVFADGLLSKHGQSI